MNAAIDIRKFAMIHLDGLNVVALISLFIAVLLLVFLLTVKAKNYVSNRFLAGFILFCAIDILGIFISKHSVLYLLTNSFLLLMFPTFYFYVLSVSSVNFKCSNKLFYHLIPFILYLLAFVLCFLSSLFFEESLFTIEFFEKIDWFFRVVFLKFQAALYALTILYILRMHKKIHLENYTEGHLSLYKWLFKMVLLFLLTLPLTIAKEFFVMTDVYGVFKWVILGLLLSALFMFSWIVFMALYHPDLFRGVDFNIKPIGKTISTNDDEKGLNDCKSRLIVQLKTFMSEQEPFLNPSLTLQDVSMQLKVSSRELSHLINKEIGQHFFDFVNEYRIRKAIDLLKDFSNNKLTIQQVFYDVGFNSKSSFNTAFKKYTRMTPTEFKKKRC